MSEPTKKPRPRLNAVMYTIMLEELVTGPSTTASLCEVSGMERKTAHSFLRALKSRGLVHLSAWDKDCNGRQVVPVYSFGPGKDAKRKPKTQAELCRAYRSRVARAELAGAMAG